MNQPRQRRTPVAIGSGETVEHAFGAVGLDNENAAALTLAAGIGRAVELAVHRCEPCLGFDAVAQALEAVDQPIRGSLGARLCSRRSAGKRRHCALVRAAREQRAGEDSSKKSAAQQDLLRNT